ncbi:RNA polymerase sigma factor [Dorea sp. D27]|uniref:RNA polymerase sigma factor n=1 Tax=Dorea sp. D27 TaxID=658665 RepID=UPI00067327B7|nr:sigma-70 family RNA polymerase sigma factor [Dorea sp. D27]KMZ54558.1 putative RNA polymerase ECF-type sigma factor [Dorea sp. D27]
MKCDASMFAQLYETVYKDLYRFALCLVKDGHDAEDAVSEAVVSAYENIGKLRKAEAFKSWIFTILANVCRRKLRKDARLKSSEQPYDKYEDAAGRQPDYGLALDVKRAFFILEEEEQLIIGLSVFGGYNSAEIGTMLSLNASTVRSKRKRALEKMECVLR